MDTATLDKVLDCPTLPSLPTVAVEVLDLTRQEQVQFKDIESVVLNDPALVSKILRTVNSSFYGLSKPCPTIGRALTYLGLNTVKSLVLGFSLVDLSGDDGGLDLSDYWQRCLYSAAAARRIASALGNCDPEEAFIAALMQDIGMLALDAALDDEYAPVLAKAGGDHEKLPGIERETFGFDHAEVGRQLGRKWRLPDLLTEPIGRHHDVLGTTEPQLVRVVCVSCRMYALLAQAGGRSTLASLERLTWDQLALEAKTVSEILSRTADDTEELGRLFKVSVGAVPSTGTLLSKAEDAKLALQFQAQREAEALQEANLQLEHEAHTDGLTQIANRKRFDMELASRFREAMADDGTVGLILTDIDKFKSFNDNYGHQAGDAVLIEFARCMRTVAGEAGLACRYGGEEFAVILPGASREDAARMAEMLRIAIEERPMDLSTVDGVPDGIPVTSSFGVAVLDADTKSVLTNPAVIVLAADKALYAAKDAGRNCARVFRAKPRSA